MSHFKDIQNRDKLREIEPIGSPLSPLDTEGQSGGVQSWRCKGECKDCATGGPELSDNLLLTRRRERVSSLNNHLIPEDDDLSAVLIIKFPAYFKRRLKATVQPPTHTLGQFE